MYLDSHSPVWQNSSDLVANCNTFINFSKSTTTQQPLELQTFSRKHRKCLNLFLGRYGTGESCLNINTLLWFVDAPNHIKIKL